MKSVKRIGITFMLCALVTVAFTACHSHNHEWKIDTEMHRKECSCGETIQEGEHSFESDVCTVCGAERVLSDGVLTDMQVFNSYGDWTQKLYFDEEGNYTWENRAEYTYDKDGNKLTEKIYTDDVLLSSAEYDYDSAGLTYKKYETEYHDDGSSIVYEYNESGDNLGYVVYDEKGNATEDVRSEYITDEKGELIGEKVYENDILSKEMKYAAGNDGEEDYLYIVEAVLYNDDGSKSVEEYDESGELIREAYYDSDGSRVYSYDLEYFYDEEDNPTAIEKKENGVLKEKIIYEYDENGNIQYEKTYEGDRLVKEVQYAESDFYMYEAKIITYNEDGTATVEEFDEEGELIG
ncbi:MAG: hypothetical protein IJN88_00660 [Clostridia bacterium]|nr:hypothetical protein [Clostridia bacterium]